jgi:hypothetical protein
MAGILTQTPSFLKKNTKKLKIIKKDDKNTIFLLSIRTKYIIENIKNMLKEINTYIRSSSILPSSHRKNFLSRYQKITDRIKQKRERQDAFIILTFAFILLNGNYF